MRTFSHSKRRKISPGLTKFYVQREEVNLNVALDVMRTMPCSQAAQQAEVYWMALLRDIPFSQFGTSNAVMQAVGNTQTRFSLLTLAFFSWFASCAPSQCGKDLRRPDLHRRVYRGRNPPPPFVPVQLTFRVSTPLTGSASQGTRTATSTLCKICSGPTGRA